MATTHDSKEEQTELEDLEPRQYSVWSDLRAIKFLGQVQRDIRSLQATTKRLQILLVLAFLILASGLAVTVIFLLQQRNSLQELQERLPSSSSFQQLHRHKG